MNSSESEEDFESADEDLDLDNPTKDKEINENLKTDVNNEENSFSGEGVKEVIDKLKHTSIEEELVTTINENIVNVGDTSGESQKTLEVVRPTLRSEEKNKKSIAKGEATSGESQKPLDIDTLKSEEKNNKSVAKCEATLGGPKNSLEVDTQRNEELKIKPTVKKLGIKLTTNEPKIVEPKKDSLSRSENKNGKNEGEMKPQAMRLGTKSPSDMKTDKGSGNSVLKDFESDKITNKENVNTESDNTFFKNIHKPVETNFEAGDGWEFEEEDGFEIPVTLAKTGDSGIRCAQEQISELDQVECKPSKAEEQGWGEWGGWGVSSLLSTATGTVTTFSSHVTAGLSTVMDTTIGAPDPETLAAEQASQHENKEESTKPEDVTSPVYGGFGSIMSGVSFLGSSVINRGLDTLETIGKKTMEVLQEGDPGLKKKRAMLFQNQDKPILSQILREAKEKADNSDKEKEEKEAARKVHFESLFDDYQGMVHLEALEMLSTQCELKLQSLLQSHSGAQLLDLQETLSQVRDLCELAEEEEEAEALTTEQFAEEITNCVEGLRIKTSPAKIIKVNSEICERLEQLRLQTATEVNQTAISSLAELSAAAMECFHKSAELILAKSIHNTANEADSYVQLTNHLCARVSAVANEFTQLLTRNDPINNSLLITNIFLEASNSCSYIKNACQLLVPILQVGAVAS